MERRTEGVQVVQRVARILETVKHAPGSSLAQIAEHVDLPRSTVHRLVVALEAEGLLAPASANGGYRVGAALAALAERSDREVELTAHPHLVTLSRELDETVDLSVLRHNRVLFVDQVDAVHRLRAVSARGALFPAHCTANGKALLAALTDDELERLLPVQLEQLTPRTITTRAALLEELAVVRANGIAYDREEHTLGICAVGATVAGTSGVVAAVSVPVPAQRFYGNEQKLTRSLSASCSEITATLLGTPMTLE